MSGKIMVRIDYSALTRLLNFDDEQVICYYKSLGLDKSVDYDTLMIFCFIMRYLMDGVGCLQPVKIYELFDRILKNCCFLTRRD